MPLRLLNRTVQIAIDIEMVDQTTGRILWQRKGLAATAEYAVGTAAGAGFAGLLYKMLTGGFGDQLLGTLFDHVLSLLGIG